MAFDAQAFTVDPLQLTTPRARLEYLRDFLLRLPEDRFDMKDPGDEEDAVTRTCGSPACIGGWARAVFAFRVAKIDDAAPMLGLGKGDMDLLFYPNLDPKHDATMGDGRSPYRATATDAAAVLTHLINTGEVDWSVARASK